MPSRKPSRTRQKYTDNASDDDVELTQENDEYSSDEEIVRIHENRKQKAKRITKETIHQIKTKPHCRTICFRYFLLTVVLTVGVCMILQLYSTYGEYVTDAIFPPRTSSTGLVCQNGSVTNDYMIKWHAFEPLENNTGWAVLNATKPSDSLSFAWTKAHIPQLMPVHWINKKQVKVLIPAKNECVSLIVYSI